MNTEERRAIFARDFRAAQRPLKEQAISMFCAATDTERREIVEAINRIFNVGHSAARHRMKWEPIAITERQ